MKTKFYQHWAVHNIIAHPISGILWALSDALNQWADSLHDGTVPPEKE